MTSARRVAISPSSWATASRDRLDHRLRRSDAAAARPGPSRSAARFCSVSSCSSRAQCARSCSAAASRCRRRSASTVTAVATAVAALAANASSRRWSSALNAGPALEPVDRDQHPVGPVRGRSAGRPARRSASNAEPAEPVTLEPRPVGVVLQPKRAGRSGALRWRGCPARPRAGRSGPRAARPRRQRPPSRRPARARSPARGPTRAPGRAWPPAPRIESRSVSPPSARAICMRRIERVDGPPQLGVLGLEAGVAPRVVDRDARELGQQPDRLLVLLGELARRLPSRSGRGSRTGRPPTRIGTPRNVLIGGWPAREAVGVRVGAHVGQPQRHRMRDQLAEHPAAPRQLADPFPRLLVDADA